MKELDQFTVERLTQLSKTKIIYGGDISEIRALARIALSAKQAKLVAEVVSKFGDPEAFGEREIKVLANLRKIPYDTKLYATPPANSLVAPEGWKLVPIELTAEMAQAASEAHEGESYLPYTIYRAMLAAAPTSLLEGE